MLLVSIDSCPDRVSARLQAEAVRAGVAQAALRVEAGLPVAEAAARVAGAAAQVPAGAPVRLVGAGLAASLLLAAASGLPAGRDLQVLALFPWLGCDSTVYGEPAIEPVAASRWMALARRPPWRTLLAHVAVSPPPRGLEGVYAGGVPSWRDAAGALPGADVVSLAAPSASERNWSKRSVSGVRAGGSCTSASWRPGSKASSRPALRWPWIPVTSQGSGPLPGRGRA